MTTIPLSLVRSPAAVHVPAAWFVPGGDAAVWLAEFSLWNVPLTTLRLFVLPCSPANRAAGGVLTVISGAAPQRVERAESYGCIAGRVYLPLHAQVAPPVTPAELETRAAFAVSVFHPGVGLVGFQESEALTVASLLAPPPRRPAQWDRAQPGAALYPRLVSVEPDVVISLDDLLDAAREDIGSKKPDKIPPQKGEHSPLASKAMLAGLGAAAAAAGVLGGIGAGVSAIFGDVTRALGRWGPGTEPAAGSSGASGGGGRFDAFGEWARAQMQNFSRQLESARNRELDRLLRMLDDDPDTGLSYAIPLAGKEGRPRGVAPPGARLARRGTNFNLSSLRGGKRVDAWGMSERIRSELRQKYINAASRELELGRFRRAAYIFSELLGDHSSAANALKQGRFYREAAVIYRDVIKNKALAADCLEEGGLILEAIALREELKQWLQVARLYEKIERPDEARKAYRNAVEDALNRQDRIGAAHTLSDSMQEHDEALAVLAGGWPESMQADGCLTNQLALLGKLGRHGDALKVVQELRTTRRVEAAVEICAKVIPSYPDAAFRVKTADVVRVLAGRRMLKAGSVHTRILATAVASLAPHDRLLARDTSRYVEYKAQKERQPLERPRKTPKKPNAPRQPRTLQLGRGAAWSAAAEGPGLFFAAGAVRFENDRPGLLVVRGTWNGELQRECWSIAPVAFEKPLLLDAPRRTSQDVVLGPSKGQRIEQRLMAANRIGLGVHVGTPNWLPLDTVAFKYNESGVGYAVRFDNNDALDVGTLDVYSSEGVLTHQYPLPHNAVSVHGPLPMAARDDRVFVANGGTGLIVVHAGKAEVLEMATAIRGIVATAPFTRLRVAVALEEGGVVLWPDTASKKQCRFGQGMFNPVIGFTRGGDLVAVTKSEVRIYHTESESLAIASSSAGPDEEPYAVLPAESVDGYAVFLKNGEVRVW